MLCVFSANVSAVIAIGKSSVLVVVIVCSRVQLMINSQINKEMRQKFKKVRAGLGKIYHFFVTSELIINCIIHDNHDE